MLRSLEITIIRHCEHDWIPLKPLFAEHVRATVYRAAKRLLHKGLLVKRASHYRATPEALRILTASESGRQHDMLQEVYPPLALVPSAQHRAIIELIFSAIALRTHTRTADHLPSFATFGGTMKWKTSTGLFICSALGLKPEEHIVDLSTESGRSVWVRKTSTGDVVFKRALLEEQFVCMDEYLLADKKVKVAIGHFISGRRVVPMENETLEIQPTALLTLNPKDGDSLERRTTFPPAQLRRLVLLDADKVDLPDLALEGNNAIDAAKKHGSLVVSSPKVDCRRHRAGIVRSMRRAITCEAESLVDYELLIHLCTGTTAFLEKEDEAIRHALFNYLLIAETLGWTREDWFDVVNCFCLSGEQPAPQTPAEAVEPRQSLKINLWPLGRGRKK